MTHEEFIQKQKEARERFEQMTPEQQKAFLAVARRHHAKARDEFDTSFVIGIRKKLENDPESVTPEEYKEYLAILEKDKERVQLKKNDE